MNHNDDVEMIYGDKDDWYGALSPTYEPFEKNRRPVEFVLNLHAEAMDTAREALKLPGCRFDVDYASDWFPDLPHLAKLRAFARLFAVEAVALAHAGKPDEAAESLLNVFRLTRSLDEEPFLISKLVAFAIRGIGLTNLEQIEQHAPLSDVARRRVLEHLVKMRDLDSITHVLMGERALTTAGILSLIETRKLPQWAIVLKSESDILANLHSIAEDYVRFLRGMSEIVGASRMPSWQAIPRIAMVERRSEEDAAKRPRQYEHQLWGLSVSTHAHICRVRAAAGREAAIIGLACELHRSARGEYPETLDDLVPDFLDELPPDPFTGKPFVYKLKDDGSFVVYSVGENLTDNDGRASGTGEAGFKKGDIVWTGKPPPPNSIP